MSDTTSTESTPDDAGNPRWRAVLVDVDGTLVDTNYVHTTAWWEALRQHGHVVPMAEIHRAIGLGSDKILEHLLGSDRDPDEDEDVVAAHDVLVGLWHTRVQPMPGAADLLRAIAASGARVVLASSAAERDLEVLRAVIDADDAIAAVTTASEADASKPDTDILDVALDKVGVNARDAVFVGDAVWDVLAAKKLGMACIGLECGGTSAAELSDAGADEVWADPADLLAVLSGDDGHAGHAGGGHASGARSGGAARASLLERTARSAS